MYICTYLVCLLPLVDKHVHNNGGSSSYSSTSIRTQTAMMYLMSNSQSDLLQAKALRSNINSLRSRISSTDNIAKPCIITMPHKCCKCAEQCFYVLQSTAHIYLLHVSLIYQCKTHSGENVVTYCYTL